MGLVFLDDQGSGKQMVFRRPHRIITAKHRDDLPAAFAAIDAAQAEGHWLAGTLAYELGHALETKFSSPDTAPLIELGVFDAPDDHAPIDWLYTRNIPKLTFEPHWSEEDYLSRFERVQAYLRDGDCYQVNLTFPMTTQSDVSLTQLYAAFRRQQPGRYGAIVDLGETSHVSFSPELFFEKRGQTLRMRPMKGTRPRGENDAEILAEMRAEPKSQAENLMIVDLLRNDLSRLCKAGSVDVPELFTLETYPTLHQMTSQVTGELRDNIGWGDIFSGLFPCGSVTGAPKIRAMEIIDELESTSRRAYCGSVGYIAPNGDASFSVAIRTVQMRDGELRYDVGSGVVLDSDGPDEYRECLLKARIFEREEPAVIETFKREANGHVPRESYHIRRLSNAIGYDIEEEFETVLQSLSNASKRIRIEARKGQLFATQSTLKQIKTPLTLTLSRYSLDRSVQHSTLKISHRDFYDGERARLSALFGIDEVIFTNAKGQICEGSFTSIFIERNGQLLTPPLSDGLLPGVLRAELIEIGKAIEQSLSLQDIQNAENIFVGNSLRGLMPAKFKDFLSH